ncbi:Fused nickel transport protein NikMN [Candidatus Thermoflexus japonica]|uniref:Fused nickel transport protein NikMN n=1 Tax=Candidatus Thermoflexus japonica TaxID=2035417 RepID=A0A2H5Y4C9_9CHLR|nr:Fused nickel transport protein NikMN [Candidatus Thermoflexus japonica]
MHIPDGFLSPSVALPLWGVSAGVSGYALRRVSRELAEHETPVIGVVAAGIFAAQMLNFPIAGGTSGHLIGTALATLLFGPWVAILIMTCVLSIQALVFQDGGLIALGANIFNMGVLGALVAYAVDQTLRGLFGGRRWTRPAAAFLAGWAAVVMGALATGLELALSGLAPANVVLPAMGGIHALIGVVEGLITMSAAAFLATVRRELVAERPVAGRIPLWIAGLAMTLILTLLAPIASSDPDGLERVAEDLGFIQAARPSPLSLLPDYAIPGLPNPALATILAGVLGALLVFGLVMALWLGRRARRSEKASR